MRRLWRKFELAGIDNPRGEAKSIIAYVAQVDPISLGLTEQRQLSGDNLQLIEQLADRRLDGEPLARLLGSAEFYGLTLSLGAETLIPRSDTESLIDLILTNAPSTPQRVLDIGTGSGAIMLALLSARPKWAGVATDISAGALAIARDNAIQHQLADRIEFRLGSMFEPLNDFADANDKRFDLIVSNPPYIRSGDIAGLQREVKFYDPPAALDGGEDGLFAYRVFAAHSNEHLKPGGLLAVEIGHDQANDVCQIWQSAGFKNINVHPDLSGLDRAILATGVIR
jgi:release factor glutamine methyltransferase